MWKQREAQSLETLEAHISKHYPSFPEAAKAVAQKVYADYPITDSLQVDPQDPERVTVDPAAFVLVVGNLRNALALAIIEAVESRRLMIGN